MKNEVLKDHRDKRLFFDLTESDFGVKLSIKWQIEGKYQTIWN
jgi:hypothetical protein